MKEQISIKNFLIVIFVLLISSCASEKTNDFDLSDIKRPIKKELKEKESKVSKIELAQPISKQLKSLKKREEILSEAKFGEKDPFSLISNSSGLLSKLELKGFLTISDKNYAMVKYLDNEGPIFLESIGGENTNLLPEGAVVKEIMPNKGFIKISYESENFILYF